MNKTHCIICKNPATRSAKVGVCLEHWQGRWRDTGAAVGLCDEHTINIAPLLILNNPIIEEN